jgi:thioredoxin reductase
MTELDVAVVGAGPSGLAAALELRRLGATVAVYDREATPGGIPRHTRHTGYGIRDLHRLLDGPSYAARYTALVEKSGAEMHVASAVLECAQGSIVSLSAGGVSTRPVRAIVLATGCRERPRTARLVPGDRPAGVFTTGSLQQFADLYHLPIGTRAVVVGAEHVSFSAVHTLAAHGVNPVAVITSHPHPQSYLPLQLLTTGRHRVRLLTNTDVVAINGRRRVQAVEVKQRPSGRRKVLPCDTVVFTGDWIPDNELARSLGLAMAGTAPQVDQAGRTSIRGIFAAGNTVHAAETADISALGGRHVARAVAAFLDGKPWPEHPLEVVAVSPLAWVSPSRLSPQNGLPSRGRLITRISEFRGRGALELAQQGRVLHRERHRRLVPNRSISIDARSALQASPSAGPLVIRWTAA